MDNATVILKTLDGYLSRPARLVLYGRAALQLGFANPPPEAAESQDVDAIIPLADLNSFTADQSFWEAQEATNKELRPRGLYITHLFRADQVLLRPDWEQHIVPITQPVTRWLRLFRPATIDLILTKMMRGDDPQDMADVAFLIRSERITLEQVQRAMAEAIVPDLVELREAFQRARPRVCELARGGL